MIGNSPDNMDVVIGKRIKTRRLVMNVTQKELANLLNITFQQIQKYEKGKSKISAVALYTVAKRLCAPLDYFFGIGAFCRNQGGSEAILSESAAQEEYSVAPLNSLANSPESRDLLKSYYQIKDEKVRKHVLRIIEDLAAKTIS